MCPYIKSLIPEFVAFCYLHNLLVTGLCFIQFKGYRARNLKSAPRYALGWFASLTELYSTKSYYHYLVT